MVQRGTTASLSKADAMPWQNHDNLSTLGFVVILQRVLRTFYIHFPSLASTIVPH